MERVSFHYLVKICNAHKKLLRLTQLLKSQITENDIMYSTSFQLLLKKNAADFVESCCLQCLQVSQNWHT